MADDMDGESVLVLSVIEIHMAMLWTRIFMCVLIEGIQVPVKILDLKHIGSLCFGVISCSELHIWRGVS
jgi:hypothetical protein